MDRRPEVAALTGLRGALAMWVVLFHLSAGFELLGVPVARHLSPTVTNILFSGSLAVDGFFILSGFVLSYAHAGDFTQPHWRQNCWQFWALRLARLYPVHAAVLACYVALQAAGFPWIIHTCGNPANRLGACDRFSLAAFVEQALLVASWGIDRPVGWNFVSWSISAEWFAYLCFPLLAIVAGRIRAVWALPVGLGLIAAMIPTLKAWGSAFHGLPDDYGLLRIIPLFSCGCLLYRVAADQRFEHWPWPAVALGCLVALLLLIAVPVVPTAAALVLAPMILALSSRQSSPLSVALSNRPMLWLGRISYSLYLTHFLVLELANVAIISTGGLSIFRATERVLVSYTGATVATLLVAWLVHRWIEEPSRRALRSALGADPH